MSTKPNPLYIAALIHEQTHIERQKKLGLLKWGLKYVFFPKFRFNEELEAIKAQMVYLKKHKKEFNFEKRARFLSGWLYYWPVSYRVAKKELERVWKEI